MSYRQSYGGGLPAPETILTTVVAAAIASAALGGVLHATGDLRTMPAIYGLEGVVNEWTLVFCHGLVAGGPFVAFVTRLARSRRVPRPLSECRRTPFLCACLGLSYGAVLWVTVVAYGAPFVLGLATGNAYPVSTPHMGSFYALIVFGVVYGAWYPLLWESFAGQ